MVVQNSSAIQKYLGVALQSRSLSNAACLQKPVSNALWWNLDKMFISLLIYHDADSLNISRCSVH